MIRAHASLLRRMRALAKDRRGVTIVEFALIAPTFVMMLLGLFDLGYQMYLQSVIEGTLQKASRVASIGTSGTSAVDTYVRQELAAFPSDSIDITKKSYYQFSGVSKAEADIATTNSNAALAGNGVCDANENYIDENDNGVYDNGTNSGTTGLGSSDDIIFYTVTVRYTRLFPLYRFLGLSSTTSAAANTVLRNQPYGAQASLPSPTPCP